MAGDERERERSRRRKEEEVEEEAQPLNYHQAQARALADRLLQDVGTQKREYKSERLEIYLADVEMAVDRFHYQLQFHRRDPQKQFIPCVILPGEEQIVIDWLGSLGSIMSWPFATKSFDIFNFHGPRRPFMEEPFFADLATYYSFFCQGKSGYQEVAETEAIPLFREGLTSFLTTRLSARQSNISTSPGLPFRVITERHGLRVHYSPSYFFNPSHVFGSPTSPVDGWIQPGCYKFGGVGPAFFLTFDPANFHIPPSTQAQLVGI